MKKRKEKKEKENERRKWKSVRAALCRS